MHDLNGNQIGSSKKVPINTSGSLTAIALQPFGTTNVTGKNLYIDDFIIANKQDTEITADDCAALTLGDISAVTADMAFPSKSFYGSAILWVLSEPAIISDTGVVVRPAEVSDKKANHNAKCRHHAAECHNGSLCKSVYMG